jgi:hypothetical protein
MERDPDKTPISPTSSDRERFLIPPDERVQFIILFTILSGLSWAIGTLLIRYLKVPITGTMFDSGLVQGVFIGIAQWFVLKSYISSKFWILLTALGWAVSIGVSSIVLTFINERIGIFAFICLGFAQWLLLRRYIKHSWVWILIPVLPAILVTVLDMGSIPKPNAIVEIVRIISLGGIPAFGLCFFHRKGW